MKKMKNAYLIKVSNLLNTNAVPIHFDKYGTNCLFYIDDDTTFKMFYSRFPNLFYWTRYNGETPYGHLIYRNKIYKMPNTNRNV